MAGEPGVNRGGFTLVPPGGGPLGSRPGWSGPPSVGSRPSLFRCRPVRFRCRFGVGRCGPPGFGASGLPPRAVAIVVNFYYGIPRAGPEPFVPRSPPKGASELKG